MSRRTVVLSVALVAVWAAPVVAPPVDPGPPPAAGRTLTVDAWSAPAGGAKAATSTTWRESAVLPAGDTVLVGADWGGDADVEVEVRSRTDGAWGAWTELHLHDEHVPDPDSAEAGADTLSEPVWVGRSEALQFRVAGGQPDLEVSTVDIAGDLGWTPAAPARGAAVAATEQPAIRPRASWGADESLRDGRVDYSDDVRFSVVHHEGGSPRWSWAKINAGCVEADDAIRAIYRYHTVYKGYWDIAYNFVVDPCGGIWEGRYGGIDKAVMGAHAAGWNDGSVGVLALGTFSDGNSDPVTEKMVTGIEELLAWKLDHHHVDPRGTIREEAGGGDSNRYPRGTMVDVPILSAHQITNNTSCPGAVLMGRLFDGAGSSAKPKAAYVDAVETLGLPKAYDRQPPDWRPVEPGDRPDWDVTFTEPLDWSLRITDEDDRLIRSTGGRQEKSAQRVWDLRDEEGHLVPAGTYTATITGVGKTGEITPVVTEVRVSPGVTRRAGADRVKTAVELSEWAFEAAETVVLASSGAYPDALVASPLAGSYAAPVLLTHPTELPEAVIDEIERLGAERVIVTGGTKAVSGDVTKELAALGLAVERLSGADRFATAAAVASRIVERDAPTEVAIAVGAHEIESRAFPDALSAGAFGADQNLPVLLTAPSQLPDPTAQALTAITPQVVTVFGGTGAIPAAVETQIRRAAGGAEVQRFAGTDRFDTARLAAEEVLLRRGDTVVTGEKDPTADDAPRLSLVFASGLNWPDALGAGAAAAATKTVFLLVARDDIAQSPATQQFLTDNDGRVDYAEVAGGSAAIRNAVVDALVKYVSATSDVEVEDWPPDPNPLVTATAEPTDGPTATEAGTETPTETATETPSPSPSPSPAPAG
jgi:hypothetical protein